MSEKQHFIGLTRENVERLQRGEPMMIDGKRFGIDDPIYVIYGESLEEMQKIAEDLGRRPVDYVVKTTKPGPKLVLN